MISSAVLVNAALPHLAALTSMSLPGALEFIQAANALPSLAAATGGLDFRYARIVGAHTQVRHALLVHPQDEERRGRIAAGVMMHSEQDIPGDSDSPFFNFRLQFTPILPPRVDWYYRSGWVYTTVNPRLYDGGDERLLSFAARASERFPYVFGQRHPLPSDGEILFSSFVPVGKLNMPTKGLALSVRTAGFLERHHLPFVGDLVAKTEAELRQMGFSRPSVLELKDVLEEMGLRLGIDTGTWTRPLWSV